MNLQRKLEIIRDSIHSVATHSDADAAVRSKALDAVETLVLKERALIEEEIAKSIKAELGN